LISLTLAGGLTKGLTTMETILVIEDDPRIQRALARQFTAEGYTVHAASNGDAGLAAVSEVRPHAVVLDLMLPGLSGREICKKIKSESEQTPVIILSAVSEVADKVLLLELGADDYVTKPFSPRELLARVQAAIRRNHRSASLPSESQDTYSFGAITVNFTRMNIVKQGVSVVLTAHEFKLLKYFIEHSGQAISREKLLNEVWGYHHYPTTRTVDNLLLKLRQKLEPDPANPVYFQTMHGIGYKFELQPTTVRQ
jgi:DNA-binding response OmpR family regulator